MTPQPDALAEKHESLERWWHLLEWLPRRQWHKTEDAAAPAAPRRGSKPLWERHWVSPHHGQSRVVPDGAWLHPSVRERLAQYRGGYHPPLPARCVDIAHVPGNGYLPTNVPQECESPASPESAA